MQSALSLRVQRYHPSRALGIVHRHCDISIFGDHFQIPVDSRNGFRIVMYSQKRSQWVREILLTSFCGLVVSQIVPFPLSRFFTRSLYIALKNYAPPRGRYQKRAVRLSHTALWDLQSWVTILAGDGRLTDAGRPSWWLHTDAADIGYGGTLGRNRAPGFAEEVSVQGIWSPFL